jgi:L-fucono-1,5-lactonase
MIVDAHQHFWNLERCDYAWLTADAGVLYRNYLPADLAGMLREQGVDATVLIQAAASEAETHYLFELARAHAFVAGVVGWVDFESPAAPRSIASLAAAGGGQLKGLRPMIQDIGDSAWITSATLDAAFEAMVRHDLVFDALVRPEHLEPLRARLVRHPTLRAVLDHAGKPRIAQGEFDPWAHELQRLAHETSVCCKLSGLLSEAGERNSAAELARYVAQIFAAFGPQRVLWGSDWPVLNAVSGYVPWLKLSREFIEQFAAGHAADVLGNTARRVYRLTPHWNLREQP